MRVDLPDVLSLLAHEVRSPLSVLQGYVRLLQRQRDVSDPESAILTPMLNATTRLATLGRQASDLAVWLKRREPASPVLLRALLEDVTRCAPPGLSVAADAASTPVRVLTPDPQALAQSVCALAELVMRETSQRTALIAISGGAAEGGACLAIVAGAAPDAAVLALPATEAVPFERGGLGLSLVFASYVLDAHRARVARTSAFERIDVELPTHGGTP
jgi:light-regulated signal transduction histidine kinase (bacteriophytochrome)